MRIESITWCEPDGCQASSVGLICEECECDITNERHAVVTEDDVVYSLCVRCGLDI